MTIKDYVSKHARTARSDGAGRALYEAASEAALTAAAPLARARATPIWAADWDVCLVLDGCRLDLWREVVVGRDGLGDGGRWSVGSASPEWLTQTFAAEYADVLGRAGYVTANPFSGKEGDEVACMDADLFPLADRDLAHLDEVWRDAWPASEDLPTVDPETVTERAFWAWGRRRELGMDRLVVHYMQPHIPFKKRPEWCAGWDVERFGTGGGYAEKDDWKRVRDGEIPADEFWNAYAANLEWVLQEVDRWRQCTDARILVTSDHGNAMGEWGQWSHPPESANPVLRKVPWVFVGGEGVESLEPAAAPVEGDGSVGVGEQLSALGYK